MSNIHTVQTLTQEEEVRAKRRADYEAAKQQAEGAEAGETTTSLTWR